MAGSLAPVLKQRFFDANGNPLSGGKVYTYQAGTTTPQATYTDSTLGTPNANPVVLDADGYAAIWLSQALSYKFVVKTSADVTLFTTDNHIGALTADAVATAALQDLSVTTAKLAANAVTTAKITDDNVTEAKLAAAFKAPLTSPGQLGNVSLSVTGSVSTHALTIALKTAAGTDATALNPIKIGFRNNTAKTGTYASRTITAAASIVIPNTATMGHSTASHYLFVYSQDVSGTPQMCVSSVMWDDGTIQTSTGISTGSDSNRVLYGEAGGTGPVRLLARIKSTQSVAGVWDADPTEVALYPFEEPLITARYTSSSTANLVDTTLTVVPFATKVFDTWNAWVTDTFTCPRTGYYVVGASFGIASAGFSGGAQIVAYTYVDGAQGPLTASFFAETGNTLGPKNCGRVTVFCTAGQTIAIYMAESSAGAQARDGDVKHNWVEVTYLGNA